VVAPQGGKTEEQSAAFPGFVFLPHQARLSPSSPPEACYHPPISIIFERSWTTGEVPEDSRKANVTPVFKKGKKEDPGNYRPVSLTSIPGKVMEQLILEVIIKQVEEKKVIGNSQHGFTQGEIMPDDLIAFYDDMTG